MSHDVASAMYREQPVNVLYLDRDPVAAAQAHTDFHVVTGVRHAVQLLSNAWHELLNPMYQQIEEADDYPQTFTRHPGRGEPKDLGFPELKGEPSYWMLFGQRILQLAHQGHPHSVWAMGNRLQYDWVHAYAIALCEEHSLRFGKPHPMQPLAWTLELVPAPISSAKADFSEPAPVVPERCLVLDGEYYDAIASYRNYYVLEKQPLLKWTRREPPEWILRKGDRYELVA